MMLQCQCYLPIELISPVLYEKDLDRQIKELSKGVDTRCGL
jgi:hypothetical protein